jgi:uncharacterized protein
MPSPDIKPGSPCWIHLITSDAAKARDFYASRNGKMVAGIM